MPARKRTEPPIHGPADAAGAEEEYAEGSAGEEGADSARRRPRKRVAIRVEYSIGRRDVFNFDPKEGDEQTETEDYQDSEEDSPDENYYPDEDEEEEEEEGEGEEDEQQDEETDVSVGSEAEGVSEVESSAYTNNDNDDEDEDGEGISQFDNGALLDDDERYARLLQQQEIVLAHSQLHGSLQQHPWIAAMAESEESIDMSYEGLLELQENLGEVKRRGLEEHTLRQLLRITYRPGGEGAKEETRNCVVCMSDFACSDELIQLPCLHHFHQECALNWLRQRASCPICRESIAEAPITIDLR